MGGDEFGVVFPAVSMPGALAVVCMVKNAARFRALQAISAPAMYGSRPLSVAMFP